MTASDRLCREGEEVLSCRPALTGCMSSIVSTEHLQSLRIHLLGSCSPWSKEGSWEYEKERWKRAGYTKQGQARPAGNLRAAQGRKYSNHHAGAYTAMLAGILAMRTSAHAGKGGGKGCMRWGSDAHHIRLQQQVLEGREVVQRLGHRQLHLAVVQLHPPPLPQVGPSVPTHPAAQQLAITCSRSDALPSQHHTRQPTAFMAPNLATRTAWTFLAHTLTHCSRESVGLRQCEKR